MAIKAKVFGAISKLDGYKTYLTALAIGIASAVFTMGWIDQPAYTAILGLLGASSVAFLRHGVSKANRK